MMTTAVAYRDSETQRIGMSCIMEQNSHHAPQMDSAAGACFSKVFKLFGPISGATIRFMSAQRRGSRPSNFAILLVFLTLKNNNNNKIIIKKSF